ncbi:MAG: peroxide stress protein YaaA [Ruminiclostridium sp.]|nr:peroxide stress protein YaaA [Ruminiclostridium sp.]
MQIIISPAKKMRVDTDSFAWRDLPAFLPRTELLFARLKELTYEELKDLWKCNDKITVQNIERLQTQNLHQNLTPAVMAYEGIQYQYMAPGVFSEEALSYLQDHLRILSGFYGILRPFDGVIPYRLEMQAKLITDDAKDLYAFWGSSLADSLWEESNVVINLASKEYSQCISRYIPDGKHFLTCTFGERKGNKIIEKGTLCKMARGEMVRYLAETQADDPEQLKDFDRMGYRFSPDDSTQTNYVFIKED